MFKKILVLCAISLMFSCSSAPTDSDSNANNNDNQQEEENNQESTTGILEVTISTSGNELDPDGYDLALGDIESQSVEANQTATFDDVEEGTYDLSLSGLADNCSVSGDNPVSVDITADKTVTAQFDVVCEQTTPQVEGLIAFTKLVDQNFEIFTMNADGSNQQRLTDNSLQDDAAHISPDGTKIVYSKQSPDFSNNEIWVMDIDGSNKAQLTSSSANDRFPTWSPDGTRIAFESDRDGDFNIYVSSADPNSSTVPIQLTSHSDHEQRPAWSPNGDKIMFTSTREGDGTSDIYTIDTDGTGLTKIVDASSENGNNLFDPVWSPDGTQIAYQGFSSNGGPRAFIANADGSNPQMLVPEGYSSAYHPSWSPSGNYLAFTDLSNGSSYHAIWIVRTDGSGAYQLTDSQQTSSSFPDWGIKAHER